MKFPVGQMDTALAAYLAERHDVKLVVETIDDLPSGNETEIQIQRPNTLYLAPGLRPGQRAFQLGTQIAMLAFDRELTSLVDGAGFTSQEAARAGAHRARQLFRRRADHALRAFPRGGQRAPRYDIDLLGQEFGVGFETICHPFQHLAVQAERGVPFFFIRVDRAGNISKRQSATDFHFSRIGGTCPLWNVYEAFASPGRILTQSPGCRTSEDVSGLPNGVACRRKFGAPSKTFAVALGCDIRYADRVVYSAGLL